jgi:hypothetical protein
MWKMNEWWWSVVVVVVVCRYLQNFLILADSGNSFSSQWDGDVSTILFTHCPQRL